MKKLTALMLALMLMLSVAVPVQAAMEYKLLYDATEKLDRDMCWELGSVRLTELSDAYKTQIRVDVVNNIEEYTLDEYAEVFCESFEYGYSGTLDCIYLMLYVTEDETGLSFIDYTVYCGGENKQTLDGILTLMDAHLSPWLNQQLWNGTIETDNAAFQGAVTAFADCAEGFLSGELEPIPTEPPVVITKHGHYVNDESDLLTGEQWQEINEAAIAVSQSHDLGIHLAIVLDYAADGSETIQEAAQKLYADKGMGRGPDKDGILLMISMAEGHYTIYTHGKCELLMGDLAIGELSDILLDEFAAGRPAKGLLDYIAHCNDILSGKVNYEEETAIPVQEAQKENKVFTIAVIIAAGVLCILILRTPKKKPAQATPQETPPSEEGAEAAPPKNKQEELQ